MTELLAQGEIPPLSRDLIQGADAIGAFIGMKPRRVYYLASTNRLPGVWRDGKQLLALKSKIREGLEAKAAGKSA